MRIEEPGTAVAAREQGWLERSVGCQKFNPDIRALLRRSGNCSSTHTPSKVSSRASQPTPHFLLPSNLHVDAFFQKKTHAKQSASLPHPGGGSTPAVAMIRKAWVLTKKMRRYKSNFTGIAQDVFAIVETLCRKTMHKQPDTALLYSTQPSEALKCRERNAGSISGVCPRGRSRWAAEVDAPPPRRTGKRLLGSAAASARCAHMQQLQRRPSNSTAGTLDR